MKAFLITCSGLLFLGVADLPIGYYTLLRITVTVCAVLVLFSEYENGIGFWIVAFALVAILFNPLIPVYLHDKSVWAVIDVVCGGLFITKALAWKTNGKQSSSKPS